MKNSDFITGRVPITKEEVRAVSIMKLDLVNAKRFIDVGAGTGSVSVEAAYNYPNPVSYTHLDVYKRQFKGSSYTCYKWKSYGSI